MNYRKINKDEFDKLKRLFPDNDELWKKYKAQRISSFDNNEIDIFVIEYDNEFIGEVTINYVNHDLQTETIPNKGVYLEAYRVDKKFQGKGLGQKLINFVINELITNGYTEFTIGVEEDNEIAKHIYFKLGFTEAIDKGYGDEFGPSEYTLYLKNVEMDEIIKKLMLICDLGEVQDDISKADKDYQDLLTAGFSKVEKVEILENEYFETPDDLITLLLKVPILDDFSEFDFENFEHNNVIEKDLFEEYVKKYKTEKGILLKRVLYGIVAKK